MEGAIKEIMINIGVIVIGGVGGAVLGSLIYYYILGGRYE